MAGLALKFIQRHGTVIIGVMSGTLFVVATPIGNLEDLTFRALRILREVDLIAAEDTRRTAKLLTHYEIRKPMISVREHNEARQSAVLIKQLLEGKQIALVSDAGTPAVADPGARLVRAAHEAEIRVVPIPGCSAIMAALSASGFEGPFSFLGFPPAGQSARRNWLKDQSSLPHTLIMFEAPHRVVGLINDVNQIFVKRPCTIWREITKIHEQLVLQPIIAAPTSRSFPLPAQGEFTIIIGPPVVGPETSYEPQEIAALFDHIAKFRGISEAAAADLVSTHLGIPAHAVKKAVKRQRILVKRQKEAEGSGSEP